MHHIVSDGWSMGVLVRELAALYAAFAAGRPSPLPALPVQYADYAVWQRGWLQGEVLEAQLAYWREQLAGAPAAAGAAHRPAAPAGADASAARRVAVLLPAAAAAGRSQALGQREGATLFMTLLAAFQALLARYTGQDGRRRRHAHRRPQPRRSSRG